MRLATVPAARRPVRRVGLDLVLLVDGEASRWLSRSDALDVAVDLAHPSAARVFSVLVDSPSEGVHVLYLDGRHGHVLTFELPAAAWPAVPYVAVEAA